ncbi:alpha/beta hydrolase [Paucilactobacillus kaifaensis]|uniref:alpha/beta hydrolase n=1 Tax=Paucilactobacillus kaifaensis TaxID=2559921 RepID=UPI0010F7CD45|nr:alpha/beta hydrolase [Paucilactobacillus kaifaensis]
MQIIQKSLSTSNYDTQATLTCYLKAPDEHANQTALPALVFVPGGSYTHIPTQQAESIALAFAAQGFQCFVLRYSFTGEKKPLLPAPIIELGLSIKLIRANANDWNIRPESINVMGFSVGGHIVSLYNDYWHTDWLVNAVHAQADLLKPNAIILGYPVIDFNLGFPPANTNLEQWTLEPDKYAAQKHVNQLNAPTFCWVTNDDTLVPVANSLAYCNALAQHQIPQELHIFHHGPHGLALADQRTAWKQDANQPHVAHWFQLAIEWLQDISANPVKPE